MLIKQWIEELHELEDFENRTIEQWATADNLGIPEFEYTKAANFYPWIYRRRFRDFNEQGYAFLENAMDHAEPSFGYSVLAQIMTSTSHKIAITTNFDNLIADAISIYTRTFPLVCGHESLTGYIRPNLRRPLVAKIHRDLLLAPKNDPDEIALLPKEWTSALTRIFEHFTPIVIGYGGNDGSLMGFLRALKPIEGGIFWCHRDGNDIDSKIAEVVEHHHGCIVPIAGFDEVMLQLQELLKLPFLLPQLQRFHNRRVADYRKQFEDLTAKLRKPGATPEAEEIRRPARDAAEAAVKRLTKEKDWWAWQLKAEAEPDTQRREAIFIAGLEDFPESPELIANYANFVYEIKKDYDRAEKLYRKALLIDPNNANNIGSFANFICDIRKDYDQAERLYRRALHIEPSHTNNIGNFAYFIDHIRKDYDQAERLYRRSLEFDPNNVANVANFANFMYESRKSYDQAERLYRKAMQIDPNNAINIGNFAEFIYEVRKDYDFAESLYRKSLQIDPTNAYHTSHFAKFMCEVRRDYKEAERLFRKAIELDPTNDLMINMYRGCRQSDEL